MMVLPRKGRALFTGGELSSDVAKAEEVMPMGNGRGASGLRCVVCLVLTLVVMLYISPKAC